MSATAGTSFQDTRKPLRLWFQALWGGVGQKHGARAFGLNRVLGIGSDRTAWTWLHKLRRAMGRPGREPLTGEGDETFVGGAEEGGGRRLSPHATHRGAQHQGCLDSSAAGPSCRVPAEALAAGNASRGRQSCAPRLLPGRIHLSLQSAHLAAPREALLPSGPASGRRRSRSLQRHHQACSRPAGPKAQPVGATQVKIVPH